MACLKVRVGGTARQLDDCKKRSLCYDPGSNPSPVPLRLMKTPAAGHHLPKGEGCERRGGRGLICPEPVRGIGDTGHGLTADSYKDVTAKKERHSKVKVVGRGTGPAVAPEVIERREAGTKQTIRVRDAESNRPGGPVCPRIGDGETEGRGGAVPTRLSVQSRPPSVPESRKK